MNKLFISITFFLLTFPAFSQSEAEAPNEIISNDSMVVFRLFPTKNMYNFIKLNTRNGKMWQIQWGTESKYRFETELSDISLVDSEEESDDRFFLYPTDNIYNFILLDQIDGRTWQVQWSTKEKERRVIRIY